LNLEEPLPLDFRHGSWATIDPGAHTAICYWQDGEVVEREIFNNFFVHPPFSLLKSKYGNCKIIIEGVELWGSSAISYASGTSGDLFKLAYTVGCLITLFREINCLVYIVSPRRWKGQLDYKKLRHILESFFQFEAKNDHEASAYGIGLWAKGVF